jgi:predicted CoA-substrate-specific enzyme activase
LLQRKGKRFNTLRVMIMTVCGIDIGSLSTKAVVMGEDTVLGWEVVLTGPDPLESVARVMDLTAKQAGLSPKQIQCTVATGYGRVNVPFAQATVTEISCHARGSHWCFPEVRTILDMGGQDCKGIRCDENGKLTDFVMNDKCAAGTGRYLERVAATLGLDLSQIGPLSLQLEEGPWPISTTCAVFAESSIIKLLREGKHRNDILGGATDAIVSRVISLLERVGIEEALCVSGGVAKNIGVIKRLEQSLGLKAYIAPEPQIIGALGAALFARDILKS